MLHESNLVELIDPHFIAFHLIIFRNNVFTYMIAVDFSARRALYKDDIYKFQLLL